MKKLATIGLLVAVCVLSGSVLAQRSGRPDSPGNVPDTSNLLPPPTNSGYFQGRLLYHPGEDPELKPPEVISQPDPPPLKDFSAGTVVLWCVIDKDGKINLIKVAKRLSPEADMKAAANLRLWKFKPGKLKKDEVDMLITVEVVWH